MKQNKPDVPELDVSERLHLVVENMLAPFGKDGVRNETTILFPDPFDISKPNQHDSKAEFQRELDAVSACMSHIDAALNLLSMPEDSPDQRDMVGRLMPIIDQKMRTGAPRESLSDSTELIRKNVAEVGGYLSSYLVMIDFSVALKIRYQELKEQEERFWSIKHRAPDYYARTIALRLAKLFARKVGKRPTYGTAPTGDNPSTSYGRALEEVFEILEIKQNVRTHAKWAVQRIIEEDLLPPSPVNFLSEIMSGRSERDSSDKMRKITDALMRKSSHK